MNTKRLYFDLADANVLGSLSSVNDALREYQIAHCFHPKKVRVWNPFTGQKELREVACGSCYHCRNTKINSWVTRMYAHVADFKNAYFVTLTYRSFPEKMSNREKFLLNYLQGALWHFDDLNTKQHLSWNPCVLCKKHYQDFLKRLRKHTGLTDLTYFLCGEYGHEFGRPHFHIVFFTNGTLTLSDICRAWALPLHQDHDGVVSIKTSHKDRSTLLVPFGNVDFADLVSNGSLNSNGIVVDGVSRNAHQCFRYVCKYMCKKESNSSRVRIAFDSMYAAPELWHRYSLNPEDNFTPAPKGFSGDIEYFTYPLKNLKDFYYGSNSFYDCEDQSLPLYPTDFGEFAHLFRPFTSPSRGTPIGSLYVKTHVGQMAEGVFKRPPLQAQGYIVPDYFRRKASEYIYGLRGKSSPTGFSKGNLILLRSSLMADAEGKIDVAKYHFISEMDTLSDLLNSSSCFRDFRTGIRYLFLDIGGYYGVYGYKYDRAKREYVVCEELSPQDFAKEWLKRFIGAQKEYDKNRELREENTAYASHCMEVMRDMIATPAEDLTEFCADIVLRIEDEIAEYNKMYDTKKSHLE